MAAAETVKMWICQAGIADKYSQQQTKQDSLPGTRWEVCVEMLAVKRISVFLGVLALAGVVAGVSGGSFVWQLSEPLTLLLVLGLTLVLGVLTYDPKQLGRELSRVFKSTRQVGPCDGRVMAQLALYALVAGLVLCIVQMLLQHYATGDSPEKALGSGALRTPLMSLLYGVLTAVSFWAISGQDIPAFRARAGRLQRSDRKQVVAAFCVLLLTAGAVSTSILGIVLTSKNDMTESAVAAAPLTIPVTAVRAAVAAKPAEPGPRLHLDLERARRNRETHMTVVSTPSPPARRDVVAIKTLPLLSGAALGRNRTQPAVATRVPQAPHNVQLRWEVGQSKTSRRY